jgi:hypothetical protein
MKITRAALTTALVCLFIGGGSVFAQQERYIFEVTAKNNSSRVSTVMRVFAQNSEEARAQVELNGWQVGLIKQLTFKKGDAYMIQVGEEPVRYLPIEEAEKSGLSDEELILSILGPPPADEPLPLPAEEEADDKLLYVMTVYFPFGDIEPQITAAEREKFAAFDNASYYFLFGHTDNVRTAPLNKSYTDNFDLSFKRAEAVKRILTEYGLTPEKMSTVGFGATQPAADNRRSKSGTLENRRVEIFLKKRM